MNTRLPECSDLYWWTCNTNTINFVSCSSRFTNSTTWVKLYRRKWAILGHRELHLHLHAVMLDVSSLPWVRFCYYGNRVLFKIWIFFAATFSVQSGFLWYFLVLSFSLSLSLSLFIYFFSRNQTRNCTYAFKEIQGRSFSLCKSIIIF